MPDGNPLFCACLLKTMEAKKQQKQAKMRKMLPGRFKISKFGVEKATKTARKAKIVAKAQDEIAG